MSRVAVAAFLCLLAFSTYAGTGSGVSGVGLIDTRGPEFSSLSVDLSTAVPGDTVTITFSVSEALAGDPIVRVNSHTAEFVSEAGGVYTYVYTVRPSDPDGAATITVDGADALGNARTTSSPDILTLDTPELPLRAIPALVVLLMVALFVVRRMRRGSSSISGILLIGTLLLTPAAFAQDPVVSNVTFVQRAAVSGGTEVVITYDLVAPVDPCFVVVALSKSAGADGFPYLAMSLTGDLDEVTTGTGHTIVWNVAADYPNEYLPQAQIRVTACAGDRDYSAWEAYFPAWIWSDRSVCQNNLKQMGIVCMRFANECQGEKWPPLSAEPGRLMCAKDSIFPEYLANPDVLLCPARAEENPPPYFDDKHYIYLGYLVTCDEDVMAFAAAYAAEVAVGGDFTADLPVTTSYGDVMYRLRNGIERFLIVDINDATEAARIRSETAVMFEWPDNHQAGWGGNVLFLDGHVEFVEFGTFPMTETTITALAGLAGYVVPTEWRTDVTGYPYTEPEGSHGLLVECLRHFGELHRVCYTFAYESEDEVWPPLSPEPGRLMWPEDAVYPEYQSNPELLVCPGQPPTTPAPHFEDRDYVYFGYVLLNDDDVAAFASAYTAQLAGGGDFASDLPGTVSYGDTIQRLEEDLWYVEVPGEGYIGQAKIPVLMEWPDNHQGLSGGHVMFLDGHTEWIDYPGKFPMTIATVNVLGTLAGRVPKTDWAEPCPAYTPENDPYGFNAECYEQCRELRGAMALFANHNEEEFYPLLSNEPGRLMFTEDEIHCENLDDPDTLICPGPAESTPKPYFDDQHYVYLGYLLTCDEDVMGFAAAYAAQMAGTRDFSGDLPGVVSYGTTIYRLREDVGRRLITDINNPAEGYIPPYTIPVLVEWPDNHEGLSGGHVAYLDGHVEWHAYPGEFPMTETTISTLDALAAWPRKTAWASLDYTLQDDRHKQALCKHNMSCLGTMLTVFALHSEGDRFPIVSSAPGKLMFNAEDVSPYYLDNVIRMNCPGSLEAFDPPVFDDHNYVYLGYQVMNESDLQVFATAYAAQLAAGGDFSEDIPVTTSYGDTLERLHLNIVRFLIEDPEEPVCYGEHKIPLMIEWPDNHGSIRGGNVLYMDGHVEWLDYPSEFPMTEAAMTILTTLAGRPPIE